MTQPKIFIFLNYTLEDIQTWVAVSEDGFALGSVQLKLGMGPVVGIKLGRQSKWAQNYDQHYPDGYELVVIEDINAPEHAACLERVRNETLKRADERREQHRLAEEIKKHIEVRDLTEEEMRQLSLTQ